MQMKINSNNKIHFVVIKKLPESTSQNVMKANPLEIPVS